MVATGPRRRHETPTGSLNGLAQYARERRLALALTQEDLADLAGVGLSSVRALEAGKATMTLAVTLPILDALGLTLMTLPRGSAPTGPDAVELTLRPRGRA
jgi:y4mF family transcriptional regulator